MSSYENWKVIMTLIYGNLLTHGVILGSLYALQAVGLNMIWGVLRVVNLSHGDMLIYGAFLSHYIWTVLHNPFWGLLIIPPLFVCCSVLIFPLFFQLLGKEMESLLLSFGLSYILTNAGIYIFSPQFRSLHYLEQIINLGGIYLTLNKMISAFLTIVIIVTIFVFLKYSRYGIMLRAVVEESSLAAMRGINTKFVLFMGFSLAVVLTGITGLLYSLSYAFSIFSGQQLLLKCFAVSVLGGLGNMLGSLVAGVFLGLSESVLAYCIDAHLAELLSFIVIIVVLLVKPEGIFGGRR